MVLSKKNLKYTLRDLFFSDTSQNGRVFDILLVTVILLSVLTIMLESVRELYISYFVVFTFLEIFFTFFFTIEYALRIYSAKNKMNYIKSFYGVIDLIAIVPFYITLLFPGLKVLAIIRILRFFRIFRSLKLLNFLNEESFLWIGLKKSFAKITIFIIAITLISLILGGFMYVIEGKNSGIDNIFLGFYWAIVTLTTVGYGDIVPITAIGKGLALTLMILGYGIIAVPTGLVTVELHDAHRKQKELKEKKLRQKQRKSKKNKTVKKNK